MGSLRDFFRRLFNGKEIKALNSGEEHDISSKEPTVQKSNKNGNKKEVTTVFKEHDELGIKIRVSDWDENTSSQLVEAIKSLPKDGETFEIIIEEGVKNIEWESIFSFSQLLDINGVNDNLTNIKFPSTLESISYGFIFSSCNTLKEIDLSDTKLMDIPPKMFSDCAGLEKVSLPSLLENIGHSAFYECSKLGDIDFPATLKDIDANAFYACKNISSLDFSNTSLEHIGGGAFYKCSALERLLLPSTLKSVGVNDVIGVRNF